VFEPFLFAVRCNLPINFAHRYLIGAGAGNESSRCFLLHFETTRIDSREIFFALLLNLQPRSPHFGNYRVFPDLHTSINSSGVHTIGV